MHVRGISRKHGSRLLVTDLTVRTLELAIVLMDPFQDPWGFTWGGL